uniref:Uncharacterized protein n=1 Tax=Cyprinus carpio TaxID=7962 RepID=A0A8C1PYG7_CYPCA
MFSARENRCHRFQANIFNKSKCQNCFKTVDSHKLGEADLFQQSWPQETGDGTGIYRHSFHQIQAIDM